MEKFAIKRAERYFLTGTLVIPAIELMFLWNLFKISGKYFQIADGIYRIIEKTLNQLESSGPNDPLRKYEADNRALLLLLKGACLRHLNSPLQALKYVHICSFQFFSLTMIIFRCLEEAISLQKAIKEDFFIIPYSIVEIAYLHIDQVKLKN
jgi:hypothetical protein